VKSDVLEERKIPLVAKIDENDPSKLQLILESEKSKIN